jgi:hypothetical protein
MSMPPRDSNSRVSYRVVSHPHLQCKAVAVPRYHCIKKYGGRVTLHEFLNSPLHVNVWWLQAWLVLTQRKEVFITRVGLDVGEKRKDAYLRNTWVSHVHMSNRA